MDWMIYGANGYTGTLVTRLAVARGQRPVLAGRRAAPVAALADELGLSYRVADLADPAALRAALDGMAVVAHCAGPYSATAAPMLAACLASGTHYLDITGEVDVFERIFEQDDAIRRAGIVALPGAGFDVVPSDCVAVALAAALPTATSLELAFLVGGGMSAGTAKSGIEGIAAGHVRRVDGVLVPTPVGQPTRTVPFPSGVRQVAGVRWGDLATAYRSTGIGNITTYTVLPTQSGPARWLLAPMARLLALGPVQGLARRAVAARVDGPPPEVRARTRSEVWGEVRDDAGAVRTATMVGPNGYDLTADSVVRAAGFLGTGGGPAGPVRPGAHTPGTAFGPGFLRLLDGVTVTDPA